MVSRLDAFCIWRATVKGAMDAEKAVGIHWRGSRTRLGDERDMLTQVKKNFREEEFSYEPEIIAHPERAEYRVITPLDIVPSLVHVNNTKLHLRRLSRYTVIVTKQLTKG